MSPFEKLPLPPQDGSPEAVWMRALVAWLRQTFFHGILGGKRIQHPEGGYSLVVQPSRGAVAGTTFKLFRISGNYAGADTLPARELKIGDGGTVTPGDLFTIALPIQLRAAMKPAADAVINPGYFQGLYTTLQIGAIGLLPMAHDLILGFKPSYGTGISGVEWMEFTTHRRWCVPVTVCRGGLPETLLFPLH